MGEVILYVEDFKPASSSISICRICHEEEFESCKSLEAPCACSGTVKFAHRDCIQRWCNEKGNTICEICLQKFEPGYIAPPTKSQLIDAVVTIRGSLQVPRREREVENPGLEGEGRLLETNSPECSSSPADHGANCFRSLALIFTVVLLVKHLYIELTGEAEEYPFSLVALLIIRASGIVLPMYIVIRIITAIQKSILRSISHHHQSNEETDESSIEVHS